MSNSKKKYEFFEMKTLEAPDVKLEKGIDSVVDVIEKLKKKLDDKSIYSSYEKSFEELNTSIGKIQQAIHLIEVNDTGIKESMTPKINNLKLKSQELILWGVNSNMTNKKSVKNLKEVGDNIRTHAMLIELLCTTMKSLVQDSSAKFEP